LLDEEKQWHELSLSLDENQTLQVERQVSNENYKSIRSWVDTMSAQEHVARQDVERLKEKIEDFMADSKLKHCASQLTASMLANDSISRDKFEQVETQVALLAQCSISSKCWQNVQEQLGELRHLRRQIEEQQLNERAIINGHSDYGGGDVTMSRGSRGVTARYEKHVPPPPPSPSQHLRQQRTLPLPPPPPPPPIREYRNRNVNTEDSLPSSPNYTFNDHTIDTDETTYDALYSVARPYIDTRSQSLSLLNRRKFSQGVGNIVKALLDEVHLSEATDLHLHGNIPQHKMSMLSAPAEIVSAPGKIVSAPGRMQRS
jgi:hypothetical protein